MGYGESQAYRTGLFETDDGYSIWPDEGEEEEADDAKHTAPR